jgi:hypothetical protein
VTHFHSSPTRSETGQAAVLMALLLFFAFLAFAALTIDGAMTYLVRRDLQNVADSAALAACRVIAQNDTSGGTVADTALAAAQNSITTQLGPWATYANPNVGSGVGLVKGIEVSPASSPREVRVAVQRRVPTVLTQFVGRGDSFMLAQAHCDSRAGGGLMPIAVPRYLTSKDKSHPANPAMTDLIAKKGAPLYPSDSITVTWSGRYGPFQVPVPCGNPGAPACAGNASWVASDSAVAGTPDANSGPQVDILGQSGQTNSGTANFRDFVLLDIRNVGPQDPLEYYNGVTSMPNAAKDVSQGWIYQHGYPGPNPQVGSEVAVLAGTSNNFSAQTVMNDAGYQVGDILPVIVYDGYVWKRPDFSLSVNPQSGSGIVAGCPSTCPLDSGSAIAYTVQIAKSGNTSWSNPGPSFTVNFNLTNGPLPSGSYVTIQPLTPVAGSITTLTGPNYSYVIPNVNETGWTGKILIWDTEAVTRTPFLTGIDAYATSLLNTHGLNTDKGNPSANVQFGFWNGSAPTADYTARSDAATFTGPMALAQGGSGATNLVVYGVGTTAGFPKSGKNDVCKGVPVQGSVFGNGATWSTIFSSPANIPGGIDIFLNGENSISPGLNVNANAPVATGYTLRFAIGGPGTNGCSVPPHTVDIPLSITTAPTTGATPDSFVVVQGYALMRISDSDANDVWGYAISPLYESLDQITVGLRPRLVPWN